MQWAAIMLQKAVVLGAMKAIKEYSDLHITLVGKEEEIRQYLTSEERITILHTDEKSNRQMNQ